ncbi:tetraacyldisaccharide 4'-kinase [Neptuniibacter halophilus]|uniref:tetraacyldisaccharide 4'-kinase n=1 Tax=Neptuniibacter halophilus TaxID=651666 RepID=UPI00257372EC|nr:tetraacyldisaccharide 4'-kinase [Neptuniibacter halophilus]
MSWLERRWYQSGQAPLFLRPLSALYSSLALRKKSRDLRSQWNAPVPLLVVGNISVGGTGKTPLTSYLVPVLKEQGYRPGIISRGYGGRSGVYPLDVSQAQGPQQTGDEPFMLHKRCQCPVVVGPDRVAAAQYLLQHYDCDLIISDDGLQHYRLGRDIEIAVVDGLRGLGNGCLLPAGPLRERPERLQTVDLVVCNGQMPTGLADLTGAFVMQLEPEALRSCSGEDVLPVAHFTGQSVHAVAGIGNPQRFFHALKQTLGMKVIPHPKPDHHQYQRDEFHLVPRLPIIMTEKDAVKVADFGLEDAWYLEVSARLPDNFKLQLLERLAAVKSDKGKSQHG